MPTEIIKDAGAMLGMLFGLWAKWLVIGLGLTMGVRYGLSVDLGTLSWLLP